jgi:site-specific DNA-methyltransferase (adenine-specific)
MVAYSPSTNADQILQRRVRDDRGKTVYERDANGDIVSSGAKKGVPLGDVWEIPYLNPKARERVGYPTQKPILLLERIISLSTNEGALVLDPFCGSGTTLVAAKLLNRRWFGIDISVDAVSLAEKRLTNPQRTSSMLMEKGRESYLNGDKSVDFVLQGIEYVRVHRNSGIDCILKEDVLGCPVFLRIQKDTETIYEAVDALRVASKNKGKAVLLVLATSEGANDLLYSDVDFGEIQVISTTAHAIRETLRKVRESIATPRLASAR